ncbi:MAG: hypothetical protein K0R15_2222 [Clostridiales bacterium]|nr:hypothetical protein [Clostridiales bacterium]
MNNLKQMQQKTLRNTLAFLVIMLLITGGVLYWAFPYVKNIIQGPSQTIDFVDYWNEEITFDEFKKGEIVTITTPYIDGTIAEYYTTEENSYKKVDEKAMILEIPSEYTYEADTIYDQTYDETLDPANYKYVTYTGIFINTDSEVKQYAKEILEDSLETSVDDEVSDEYATFELIILYISLIALLLSIFLFVKTLILNTKFVQRLNKRLNSENEISRFESEVNSPNVVRIGKTVFITKNWFIITQFLSAKAIHLDDIAWAYLFEQKRKGITTSFLTVKTLDEKVSKFQLSSLNVQETLATLVEYAPWAVYGYSEESKEFFKKKNWANVERAINERRNEIKNQMFGNTQFADNFEQ